MSAIPFFRRGIERKICIILDRGWSYPALCFFHSIIQYLMTMEYDEIRITTRREIVICEKAIKRLEKVVEGMEAKYTLSSSRFLRDFDPLTSPVNGEFIEWYDSCLALQRCKERLSAHWQIMKM